MSNDNNLPRNSDIIRIFETGVRVALEEMLVGRDYARVEDILRALANGRSPETKSSEPPTGS